MSKKKSCEQNIDHSVLFVGEDNICRSPMAECTFRQLKKKKNWLIDSCGTSRQTIGDSPREQVVDVLKIKFGGDVVGNKIARAIKYEDDFTKFDYILCMDKENYSELESLKKKLKVKSKAKLQLITDYSSNWNEVDDPFENADGDDLKEFEKCHDLISKCLKKFISKVEK